MPDVATEVVPFGDSIRGYLLSSNCDSCTFGINLAKGCVTIQGC